jgi:hypothetical protein
MLWYDLNARRLAAAEHAERLAAAAGAGRRERRHWARSQRLAPSGLAARARRRVAQAQPGL